MDEVRWGIVGCGDVTEVKSGPALQKAAGSSLAAVMRRDGAKAADYAKRHGVGKHYDSADALIGDPDVNAVYVATPPSSHCALALEAAEAGKPCLVEKPMALDHGECQRMVTAFAEKRVPLYVAYYRRALPRFLKVKALIDEGAIGALTSVHIVQYTRLDSGEKARGWRYVPAQSGGGLFFDLGSHGLDLLDFLVSPIRSVRGFSVNTGGTYEAEDVTAAAFAFEAGCLGTGVWNFNSDHTEDRITFTGSGGELQCPVFGDTEVVLRRAGETETFPFKNPPHVHEPLIQTIVDELLGKGTCESTGESGARTAWVQEECVKAYYKEHDER